MFITFEGIDGSGKTTQVARVVDALKSRGLDLLVTREPGGTVVGEQIRTVLMDKANTAMTARAELLLFCASRAQLVSEVLRPHLEGGGVLICDRYIDSSLAYQGYGHGLGADAVWPVLAFATSGLVPDLTIYLDISPEEGLRRRAKASQQGEEFNRLDAMASDFHQRVYAGYAEIALMAGSRWKTVNAAQTPDAVFSDIMALIDQELTTS